MLSSELEICLNEAFQSAREARHEFMTVEHLLLAIIDTAKVREILRSRRRRRAAPQGTQGVHRADHPPPEAGRRARGSADARFPACCSVPFSTSSRAARRKSRSSNVLVAIFSEKHSHAAYLLDPGHRAARRRQLHQPRPVEAGRGTRGRAEDTPATEGERESEGSSALEKYATNLNKLAQEGRIDLLIGRQLEIERTIEILCRRRKNNPLCRRGRSGQDRTGRGPRAADRRGQGAERGHGCTGLYTRSRRADRGYQVPR